MQGRVFGMLWLKGVLSNSNKSEIIEVVESKYHEIQMLLAAALRCCWFRWSPSFDHNEKCVSSRTC